TARCARADAAGARSGAPRAVRAPDDRCLFRARRAGRRLLVRRTLAGVASGRRARCRQRRHTADAAGRVRGRGLPDDLVHEKVEAMMQRAIRMKVTRALFVPMSILLFAAISGSGAADPLPDETVAVKLNREIEMVPVKGGCYKMGDASDE